MLHWQYRNEISDTLYHAAAKEIAKFKPTKEKAWRAVYLAVKSGLLTRQPCISCGATRNIHGHHEDYSRPLEVVWLCPLHHRRTHLD